MPLYTEKAHHGGFPGKESKNDGFADKNRRRVDDGMSMHSTRSTETRDTSDVLGVTGKDGSNLVLVAPKVVVWKR